MASRRKHEPVGDTPGKPPQKKESREGKGQASQRRLTFSSRPDSEQSSRQWSASELLTLASFFVRNNISEWPSTRHNPQKDDIWSQCASYVYDKCRTRRSGHSCRTKAQKLKETHGTPVMAVDHLKKKGAVVNVDVLTAFDGIKDEEDRLDTLDRLFQEELLLRDMSSYSPPNIPSLALQAMKSLMLSKRPNTVANLLTCLTGYNEDGNPLLDINRMPYPLIETNLQFFASQFIQQVQVDQTYHQWLTTMYAHFGEKFIALFSGPMWKKSNEEPEERNHHRVLTEAFQPSPVKQPPSKQSRALSSSAGSRTVRYQNPAHLTSPSRPSNQSRVATSTPSGPGNQSHVGLSSPSGQSYQSRVATSTPSGPGNQSHVGLSSPSGQSYQSRVATSTPSGPGNQSHVGLSSPSGQSYQSRVATSTPSRPSNQSHVGLSSPSGQSYQSRLPPSSPLGQQSRHEFLASTPLQSEQPSTSWSFPDIEEIRHSQMEGYGLRQREKELAKHHGMQHGHRQQQASSKTKDALVNVVGLSVRQIRRDFAQKEYTPGPSIQRTILQQAKKTHPNGRWWLKADACDVSTGLRESLKNEWSGDVDMGDGKLQALHHKYITTLKRIDGLTMGGVSRELQELEDEVGEIEQGLAKSDKVFTKKESQVGMTSTRLIPYVWELKGWKSLKAKNAELKTSLMAASDKDSRKALSQLKSELNEYKKGLYMKRRTMATHLLIFMISEELRNKKPYAIPVRVMPITCVRDATMRHLQEELKAEMEELGMQVVGFVTDGEWNTLRTMGTSRPTSLIQLIMKAKVEASAMRRATLEKILQPNMEMNTPQPGQSTLTPQCTHKAVPFDDVCKIGMDLLRGMTFQDALHAHHKRIYPFVPDPLPWVPGSVETTLECMRSIMATYLLREKVKLYQLEGVDFSKCLYIPDKNGKGEEFHDREDHGHLLKRIVKCCRCGTIVDCELNRWVEAMKDERTGLTAKALRGVDAQSVPDCERMISPGVIEFLEEKGYNNEAKFAKVLHNWHKATDGRGLSEKERKQYNMDMLHYILDDWMPFHRQQQDYSQVDINRPIKGIRGLSRETVIGLTTNISSQEIRRAAAGLPPEHPRSSTSDCVESFISVLHNLLGQTFDHKAFINAYRKIFTEYQKMLDDELPFFYYRRVKEKFNLQTLPSFNEPSSSGKPERLDRVQYRRMGNAGSMVASRASMPRQGARTIRDKYHRKEEPLPPLMEN